MSLSTITCNFLIKVIVPAEYKFTACGIFTARVEAENKARVAAEEQARVEAEKAAAAAEKLKEENTRRVEITRRGG